MTISGSNFVPSTATVTIGGVAATVNVASSSASSLVVTVPNLGSTGQKTVVVSNNNGSAPASLTNGFTATAATSGSSPTISFVSPGNGTVGTTIQIFGSGYLPGSTTVTIGGIAATVNVAGSSSNILSVTVPAGLTPGFKNVVVSNPGDGSATAINAFLAQ